jgi:hypothetical protein
VTKRKAGTKEEFYNFITAYPRPLIRAVLMISTPEKIQFNDATLGKWPESVVASYDAWGHTPGDIWGPEPGGWHILNQ